MPEKGGKLFFMFSFTKRGQYDIILTDRTRKSGNFSIQEMSAMDAKDKPQHNLPKVGMRNIKTATAAALCALVYYFFNLFETVFIFSLYDIVFILLLFL